MFLRKSLSPVVALLHNLLLAYLVYMMCRVVYVAENWHLFSAGWERLSLSQLLAGSLRFDTSAIIYTNVLYILMMLIPQPWRRRKGWQNAARWLFVVVNAVAVVANLCDAVYSQYTGRRTTFTFFSEFSNEGNLGTILGVELLHHWYLLLVGLALIASLWFCYARGDRQYELANSEKANHKLSITKILQWLPLVIAVPLCVIGMRGGASTAIRPITISNANQYVNQPSEAAIVLNTPFCLIRTAGKATFTDPAYFSPDELDALYSPVHQPAGQPFDSSTTRQPNVVVLIVESFGREYIGSYNDYAGDTPFLDSLIAHSLTFRYSYANGRKSIDAMPSILSSIPMFVEPFFLTTYSLNDVSSIAGELASVGYQTAFFHGAENGSMGFQAYARTAGFQSYYGRTEYDADPRFGGDRDFDGTWAIWDEEFLQFFALSMTDLRQPFMTSLFTASSHHPFAVPERYADRFRQPGHPIHTCVRYTDHALRQFFATAARQPWFQNTIFVITADHTNVTERPEYGTPQGLYSVPIIFYDPSGRMPQGMVDAVAQQIDIMPTLLNYLGYPRPYIAFGKDLLAADTADFWAVNYNNGIYQYVTADQFIQFDGQNITGCYNYRRDPLLERNTAAADPQSTARLKAIIQSYMTRMISNRLTSETPSSK